MQYGFPAFDDHGMPGIVTALKTDHGRGAFGEQIHDLALAFITPLGPDNNDILSHRIYSVKN